MDGKVPLLLSVFQLERRLLVLDLCISNCFIKLPTHAWISLKLTVAARRAAATGRLRASLNMMVIG